MTRVRVAIQGAGQFPEGMPDGAFFVEVAQTAEQLGFDSLWVGEHLSFENPTLEGIVALSYFAGCTSEITLGTGILLLPLRHPGLVAKQVASLDVLAGGRVILGVGVGGEGAKDFDAVEVPRAERGSRTDESLDAIRSLWARPHASHRGRHFAMDDITIDPPPLQTGGPPVWIGGGSERALRRVVEKGDGWLAAFSSPDGFARGVAAINAAAADAGRPTTDITKAHYIHTLVDTDADRARTRARQHMATRYGRPFDDRTISRYCLVGTPDDCIKRAGQYIAAGVEHLVFIPLADPRDFLTQVGAIWTDIAEPTTRTAHP